MKITPPKKPSYVSRVRYADTLYGVLGVALAATATQIRIAYIRLAQAHHPDRALAVAAYRRIHAQCAFGKASRGCVVCINTAKFKDITQAKSVLFSPERRKTYDATIAISGVIRCAECRGVGSVPRYKGFIPIVGAFDTCKNCKGTGADYGTV